MRGAQHIGVGGIGFFSRHLVAKARRRHKGRHFRATAQLVNKGLVQPRFVNFECGVGEQAVAVKALDVVALEGAAVAPDVDLIFLHGGHQHGAGHGAANGSGVEVGDACGRDMKSTTLQRRNALSSELAAAVNQAGVLGAVLHGFARNFVVIRLVGLAQVGGVGVGNGALVAHPVQGGAGV